MVAGNEFIDHVEVMSQHAIHAGDLVHIHHNTWLWIGQTLEGREAVSGILYRKFVQPQGVLVPLSITPPAIWGVA